MEKKVEGLGVEKERGGVTFLEGRWRREAKSAFKVKDLG